MVKDKKNNFSLTQILSRTLTRSVTIILLFVHWYPIKDMLLKFELGISEVWDGFPTGLERVSDG